MYLVLCTTYSILIKTMKKSKLLFALFLSVVSFASVAQKQLELTSAKNGKVKTFVIGKTIRFKAFDDTDFEKGKIQNITATSITFYLPNEDEGSTIKEIPLSDLHALQKSTTIHSVTKAVGAFFILGGAYTMASSSALAGEDGSTGTYLGLGAGMVALGVVPYLFKPKIYILGVTHTAAIK
ncbi:hypothetical protein CHU_2449 [Cytophaga hutchinsonii ATCC 33406]|uniref:Uncharacterized protein n=2 Tax=Cytophaga hutchinsonii TaxID=985 RepID=A0A6N4STD9_CYTH3|nr:hypothetical protein CHU_2449 [Cytophaga hutchinsonii ATCC 33406]